MAKARVWWDKDISAYRATFPFKQQIVDFLKKNIPHSDRSWDETNKIWTFTEPYLDGVVKFMQLAFGTSEVAVITRVQFEASSQRNVSVRDLNTIDKTCSEFLSMIPYESARKAYRDAAIQLHPDRGGDIEKMSKVNALWTRIEKEVYGQ